MHCCYFLFSLGKHRVIGQWTRAFKFWGLSATFCRVRLHGWIRTFKIPNNSNFVCFGINTRSPRIWLCSPVVEQLPKKISMWPPMLAGDEAAPRPHPCLSVAPGFAADFQKVGQERWRRVSGREEGRNGVRAVR